MGNTFGSRTESEPQSKQKTESSPSVATSADVLQEFKQPWHTLERMRRMQEVGIVPGDDDDNDKLKPVVISRAVRPSVFPIDIIPLVLSFYDFEGSIREGCGDLHAVVNDIMRIDKVFFEVMNSTETVNVWKFLFEEHYGRQEMIYQRKRCNFKCCCG